MTTSKPDDCKTMGTSFGMHSLTPEERAQYLARQQRMKEQDAADDLKAKSDPAVKKTKKTTP
jgi:hypothetical protein